MHLNWALARALCVLLSGVGLYQIAAALDVRHLLSLQGGVEYRATCRVLLNAFYTVTRALAERYPGHSEVDLHHISDRVGAVLVRVRLMLGVWLAHYRAMRTGNAQLLVQAIRAAAVIFAAAGRWRYARLSIAFVAQLRQNNEISNVMQQTLVRAPGVLLTSSSDELLALDEANEEAIRVVKATMPGSLFGDALEYHVATAAGRLGSLTELLEKRSASKKSFKRWLALNATAAVAMLSAALSEADPAKSHLLATAPALQDVALIQQFLDLPKAAADRCREMLASLGETGVPGAVKSAGHGSPMVYVHMFGDKKRAIQRPRKLKNGEVGAPPSIATHDGMPLRATKSSITKTTWMQAAMTPLTQPCVIAEILRVRRYHNEHIAHTEALTPIANRSLTHKNKKTLQCTLSRTARSGSCASSRQGGRRRRARSPRGCTATFPGCSAHFSA